MENFTQENQIEIQQNKQIKVTETLRSHFYESAKWAHVIAWLGMVFSTLLIIAGFFAGTLINAIMSSPLASTGSVNLSSAMSGIIGFLYVAFGALAFYIHFTLCKFASKVKYGIVYMLQNDLEKGITKLASYFKINGIILIVILSFYAIIFIFSIIVGIVALLK